MKTDNIDLKQLLLLIEQYFDCSLTDAEEMRLRHIAASTAYNHPALDELRACMGIRRPQKSLRHSNLAHTALAVAAALALVLTLTFNITGTKQPEATCIAYINGQRITDEESIMQLIADDMRMFSDGRKLADVTLRDQMSDIAPLIELFESEPTINL